MSKVGNAVDSNVSWVALESVGAANPNRGRGISSKTNGVCRGKTIVAAAGHHHAFAGYLPTNVTGFGSRTRGSVQKPMVLFKSTAGSNQNRTKDVPKQFANFVTPARVRASKTNGNHNASTNHQAPPRTAGYDSRFVEQIERPATSPAVRKRLPAAGARQSSHSRPATAG